MQTTPRYLSDLQPGESAVVRGLTSAEGIRRRLLDIGFVENSTVECVGRSPAGDPSAYLIRGAVIALRAEDGCTVLVEPGCPASTWD